MKYRPYTYELGISPKSKQELVIDSTGTYTVHMDCRDVRAGVELELSILIKPAPNSDFLPFETYSIPATGELYTIEIPRCSGFKLIFNMNAGRIVKIPIYVWKR